MTTYKKLHLDFEKVGQNADINNNINWYKQIDINYDIIIILMLVVLSRYKKWY